MFVKKLTTLGVNWLITVMAREEVSGPILLAKVMTLPPPIIKAKEIMVVMHQILIL